MVLSRGAALLQAGERFGYSVDAHNGGHGPVGVEGSGWRNPLADDFIASKPAMSLRRIDDFAAAAGKGVG